MDLSGIIFVVLAVAWAVYLVPQALKHHDEVAQTRSIERFSGAMRVLARREPVNRRDARLVVTPPRSGDRVQRPTPRPVRPADAAAQRATTRAAAAAAAQRRRRVLLGLLALNGLVAGLAGFGVLSWWTVTVPVLLTGLFLVACRIAVRGEQSRAAVVPGADVAEDEEALAPAAELRAAGVSRAIRVEAPYGTPRASTTVHMVSPDEDTVSLPVATLAAAVAAGSPAEAEVAAATAEEVVPVVVPTTDAGSLWDPLPVTLPTYVTKSKAARTVRTIDLGAPNTWSSGRSEADSRLVEEVAAAEAEEAGAGHEAQRAVGG